jgi:hypothetical protein
MDSFLLGGESFDGLGVWSYGDFFQQRLEEDVVVDASLDDFGVVGHVDQHGEGIFGDWRVVFDQELEIADRFEGVAFEQTGLSCAESDQVLGGWCRVLVFGCFWRFLLTIECTNLTDLGVAVMQELDEL